MQRMKKELTEDEKWAAAVSQLTLEVIYSNVYQLLIGRDTQFKQ